MSTVTINAQVDGYNDNLAGWFPSGNDLVVKASSSSNTQESIALIKFTTVGAGIGAGDTINSVTLHVYCNTLIDPFLVLLWGWWTDNNNVWGTLGAEDPPTVYVGTSTVFEGTSIPAVGVITKTLTTSIPHSGEFNVAIEPVMGSAGGASDTSKFDSLENASGRFPFIVIDYTPAVARQRTLTGVGA
jgi:hypothetical protein